MNENLHVIRAHNATADLGVALAALEAWGKDVFPVEPPPVLEPLQDPLLSKMLSYVKHAQWNADSQALSDALGPNFTWYVNAYGPSGIYYNPADWDRVP